MKRWSLLPLFLFAASGAVANDNEHYRAIYQVKPSFKDFDEEFSEIKPLEKATLEQVRDLDKVFPREAPTDREIFGIDVFDLNDDGTKEVFVWIEDRSICGANICPLEIYQRDSAKKLHLIGNTSVHDGPLVLASKTHGYHDLAYFWWEYGKEFYAIHQFNGKSYALAKRIPVEWIDEQIGINR